MESTCASRHLTTERIRMQNSFSISTIGGVLLACAVCALCAYIAWALRAKRASADRDEWVDEWKSRLDRQTRAGQQLEDELSKLRAKLDTSDRQLAVFKESALARETDMKSLRQKAELMSRDLFAQGSAREELGQQLTNVKKAAIAANLRTRSLQEEFENSREFYKGQLLTALELRRSLERSIADAKHEHESLATQLQSARSENISVNNALTAAQARLQGLDALEQQVIALEAENAQLRHDVATAARIAEAGKRDATVNGALKRQNEELLQYVETMEESRRQYEADARRYRKQYDESENESETLRVKLGDIQQRLAELQSEHLDTDRASNAADSNLPPFGIENPGDDTDDLTEIVGIGKVFEAMLHRLGVFYFRQIAAFGPAELARVNSELNEFKGRIEHDDWIGQAKELHYKKYGDGERQASA